MQKQVFHRQNHCFISLQSSRELGVSALYQPVGLGIPVMQNLLPQNVQAWMHMIYSVHGSEVNNDKKIDRKLF